VIDNIQSRAIASSRSETAPHEGRLAASTQQSSRSDGASAEVQLSQEACVLQRALQAANDAPEVRENLVNEIRGQIESGTYQVDVQALAGQLMPVLE
jgi:flagellar biosynthesis anti-sigma factor FlgM